MATPTSLKYVNSGDSCVITRSTRRKFELNTRDNRVSDNRHQTKQFILPISNDLSNNTSVMTRSMSRNIKLFAGGCEIPGDSTERKSKIHRKKNTLIMCQPDLSKYSTIPPRDEELMPEELKKEAVYSSTCPLFRKSQNSTYVEDGALKSVYSPDHCETEVQPSTTVSQNGQNETAGWELPSSTTIQKGQNETAEWELPSSTTIQKDLNSETSAEGEVASKHVLVTPNKNPRSISKGQNETAGWELPSSTTIQKGQNETAGWELPSSTTIQKDLNSETSAEGDVASKHVLVTPNKNPRSTSKVKSATKLPNFANIHKRQFEKMESVIEWKQRKQIRSNRMLMSPITKNAFCFKIPESSPLTENIFKFTATQKSSIENEGVQDMNRKKKLFNLEEMKKFRCKQNEIAAQAKENIMKKLPHVSLEQKRAQERTYLKGVRLNKRFHLQMEMRKLR